MTAAVVMSRIQPLNKKALNERFYKAVDPETAFETEVQIGFHQVAVARLVAGQAASLGKREFRILELGASTCLFAIAFLEVLGRLVMGGETALEQVDYTAVDYSQVALGAALRSAVQRGYHKIKPAQARPAGVGEETAMLAHLRRQDSISAELSLVHADANRFVSRATESFDVVILNELLDDLPCRAFYADAKGRRHELSAHAYADGPTWRVKVAATAVAKKGELADMRAGTLTATSEESLRLMHGIVRLLGSGGIALVHDYGFMERYADARQYAEPQQTLPPFVEVEYPEEDDVPKAFFRLYGNEAAHAVQITNDVNFAEVTAALEETGTVITLPHGNLLIHSRTWPDLFFKGDGVFLSEFMLLTAADDLPALLAELHDRQRELRERYVTTFGSGRTSIFSDLIYVKA